MSVQEEGAWLLAHRFELERGEARWLERLASFDACQGWYADGQLSCVDWLVWFAKMARSTAFEKLRVARQLRHRALVAAAFEEGRISYSAARVITRAEDADPGVDEALVRVAESGSLADLERAVRSYQAYRDQELEPGELVRRRRGLRMQHVGDGLVRIEGYVTELEAAEIDTAVAAVVDGEDRHLPPPPHETRDEDATTQPARDGPESPYGDSASRSAPTALDREDPQSPVGDWWCDPAVGAQHAAGRRADALVDLIRAGTTRFGPPAAGGADRYLTHIVVGPDRAASLEDGTPLGPAEAARVCCDTSVVEHRHGVCGEPVSLGRRTRVWSVAQRRAALVRDGGHCRFPGCWRRIADLHHHRSWARGGPTDIANGYLLCAHHHTLVHEEGFTVSGEPNRTLTFHRPDGHPLGGTSPVSRSSPAA